MRVGSTVLMPPTRMVDKSTPQIDRHTQGYRIISLYTDCKRKFNDSYCVTRVYTPLLSKCKWYTERSFDFVNSLFYRIT